MGSPVFHLEEESKMALTHSKQLYLHLSKYGKRNLLPVLGNNFANFLAVVHYSDSTEQRSALSKAMKMHLEKAEKFDKFMKQQLEEYELGKKFLANMMGKNGETLTEKEVDKAIEYLFPSALYVPKSRPMMKPPAHIYTKQVEAAFDATGRPFHFLFYTSKPNFNQCLHDAAAVLEKLNQHLVQKKDPPKPLSLLGGRWFKKEELEKVFNERLYDLEYEKFLTLYERLSEHPFASTVETFIKKYWKLEERGLKAEIPTPVLEENDVKVFKIEKYESLLRSIEQFLAVLTKVTMRPHFSGNNICPGFSFFRPD